jgi:hypothetical protein
MRSGIVANVLGDRPGRLAAMSSRTWLFLVLSGLATGASWLCYFQALQLGGASRVEPVDKLSVVVAMVLAVAFLGEHLAWHHWVGGLLAARLAMERLGDVSTQELSAHIEKQFRMVIPPPIVALVRASLLDKQQLEISRRKSKELIEKSPAEQPPAKGRKKDGGGRHGRPT